MKLSLLKALYTDSLKSLYCYSEAENIFYIIANWLEKRNKTDVLLGIETIQKELYLEALVNLQNGEPVQYITQETEFYTIPLHVDNRVLIPRPETEELVHWIIENEKDQNHRILDIGTGSGCIAIALQKYLPNSMVTGCDYKCDALEVARINAKSNDIPVEFFQTDVLISPIDPFDVIVSNPPYILNDEKKNMHINVLEHEPHIALFVEGDDPLLFYKRITLSIKNSNTICYFETSEFYTKELEDWLNEHHFQFQWKLDFQGKKRFIKITHNN